jgi:ERCC4-type nuclease
METIMALERKSLADIIGSVIHGRARFLRLCERLAEFRHKAILIEASYADIKTPYPNEVYSDESFKQHTEGGRLFTKAHPNAVAGSLDTINARFGIDIIYTSRVRELAAERAASWLSKHFVYFHLEQSGLGRFLQEGDL